MSALQNDALTLLGAWPVLGRLDARAASGPGLRAPLPVGQSRARPGANPNDEVGSSGAGVHRGIRVPNVLWFAAPGLALVPGMPQFGGPAPWHGRQSSVYGAGMVDASFADRCYRCNPRWLWTAVGAANQGTGRPKRWHRSSTAACRGCWLQAAHRSRALPPAPQRKQ